MSELTPQPANKYRRLLSNTLLFGLSTFSSKILTFFLTRLYTSVLTQKDYGVVDLVVSSANFLIPLVSLGISNAVIRFGLEKGISKTSVFTGGLIAIGGGFGILLLASPLVLRIPLVSGHALLLYIYVLVSCLRTLCCQFVRAKVLTRLYALDGILSTIYTIGFNLLFLLAFNMGSQGYLLAVICADALSSIFLFVAVGMWRNIRFKNYNWALLKKMLRFCLPLVPALMFWWVTNASDRYFISFMRGSAENGLYAAAYKVPTLVAIFSTVFTEAWQISAVTDGQDKNRNLFFTNVFSSLSGVSFIMGGGIIIFCRLIMSVLVDKSYFVAWQYIPILVCATVLSCLAAFQNTIYMVEKKTIQSLLTMLLGAGGNLALNALFIPKYGPQGAAFATFLSYLCVFVVRAVTTQRYVQIDYRPIKLICNIVLLVSEAFCMAAAPPLWQLWCSIILLAIAAINAKTLYYGVKLLLRRRKIPAS